MEFSANLESEKDEFVKKLALLEIDLNSIKVFNDYSNVARYYSEVSNLNDKITEAQDKIKSFN